MYCSSVAKQQKSQQARKETPKTESGRNFLLVQDNMVTFDNRKNKDSVPNVVDKAVPSKHSVKMPNAAKGGSFVSSGSSSHMRALQLATSAAMEAGTRSEASAELVMKTFSRPTEAPILPLQKKQIGVPYTIPSMVKQPQKLMTVHSGKQCKTSQSRKQRKKKPTKKRSCSIACRGEGKKPKVTKGRRSCWNMFYSDFVRANLHIPSEELAESASMEYKLLTEEEKARYTELAQADPFRVLAQEGGLRESRINLNISSVSESERASNLKTLPAFLQEQQSNFGKLLSRLKKPQSNIPSNLNKATASCTLSNLESLLYGQRQKNENSRNILVTICACLDMKSLAHLESCSNILHTMDLVGQQKIRRENEKKTRKSCQMMKRKHHSRLPVQAPSRNNDARVQPPPDQGRLLEAHKALPEANHLVGLSESSSGTPATGDSPAPSTTPSLPAKKKFLPSCFHTRPPIDPICTLPLIESSDLQDAGGIGEDKAVSESSYKQGKLPPSKSSCSSTLCQAGPRDIARHLLHKFLNQYGLFWPFQYWLLHLMEAQNPKTNSHSTNQKGVLHDYALPTYMYYQDPNHPFRKFFHPCSSKYLSVMDNLSDKLAANIPVLEEFRKLACDIALDYQFFRDGLHYVLQNADAGAFQPLLGVPDFHSVPSSEAIYNGNRF